MGSKVSTVENERKHLSISISFHLNICVWMFSSPTTTQQLTILLTSRDLNGFLGMSSFSRFWFVGFFNVNGNRNNFSPPYIFVLKLKEKEIRCLCLELPCLSKTINFLHSFWFRGNEDKHLQKNNCALKKM